MNTRLRAASLAAAASILTAALPAQIVAGTTAPAFDFDKVWNDGPASFKELDGKLVLLDFFATW